MFLDRLHHGVRNQMAYQREMQPLQSSGAHIHTVFTTQKLHADDWAKCLVADLCMRFSLRAAIMRLSQISVGSAMLTQMPRDTLTCS